MKKNTVATLAHANQRCFYLYIKYLEFYSSKCHIYSYNNLPIGPVKARHPRANSHNAITSLDFRYTWIRKIFIDAMNMLHTYICILNKFVIEVRCWKHFQVFQTTAGLKEYKQHDFFFFFGGVWWVSEQNLDHISLQIIIIFTVVFWNLRLQASVHDVMIFLLQK